MKNFHVAYLFMCMLVSGLVYGGTPAPPTPPPAAITSPDPSVWSWEDYSDPSYDPFSEIINSGDPRSFTPPWDTDDHFGVDITAAMPKSADGWRLVDKKFTCKDFLGESACGNEPNKLTVNWPRFVLYNPYTGVMRFFVLMDTRAYFDADSIYLRYELSHPDGTPSPLMFKAGELSISKTADTSVGEDNTGHEIMAAMSHNDWFIFDIPFTYPSKTFNECSGVPNCTKDLFYMYPDNLLLKIDIYGAQRQSITLAGEQTFTKNGVPISQSSKSISNPQSPGSKFSDVTDAINKYKSTKSSINSAATNLLDMGSDLRDGESPQSYKAHLGGILMNIGTGLPGISTGLAGLSVANSLISAFSDRGRGGAYEIQFDAATIQLDGSIDQLTPMHQLSIGMPGSKIYKDAAKTEFDNIKTTSIDGFSGKVGVYNLSREPRLTAHYSRCGMNVCTYYVLEDNIESILNINPSLDKAGHLTLDKIAYSVEVQSNDIGNSILGTDSYEDVHTCPAVVPVEIDLNQAKYSISDKRRGEVEPENKYNSIISGPLFTSNRANPSSDIGRALLCYKDNITEGDTYFDYSTYIKIFTSFKNSDTGEVYSYKRKYLADVTDVVD